MANKKLLFLGADTSTEDALRYAQSLGVYTIVTDYREKAKVPEKQLADEAWMINVADTDALEKRCKKEGVTAIYAGNQEFCLDQCKELCSRLGFPFYASEEGWKAARDKAFYKHVCEECGLDTPAWVLLKEDADINKITHLPLPIIIKPVDSTAQQGLSIVRDTKEIVSAYRKAMEFSRSHVALAESFIDGVELFVYGYVHEGKLTFLGVAENMPAIINGRRNFGFIAHHGRFNTYVEKSLLPLYEKVVQRLGCLEGLCVFQCMFKDGILYNFELGYRLDGVRGWRHHQKKYGISELELMVDYALGIQHKGKLTVFSSIKDEYQISASYYLWAKPGQIDRITGMDTITLRDDIIILMNRFREGDIVLDHDNMRSIAYNIVVYGHDHKDLDRKIKDINRGLHMYDKQGNDMLIYINNYYKTWLAQMKKGIAV